MHTYNLNLQGRQVARDWDGCCRLPKPNLQFWFVHCIATWHGNSKCIGSGEILIPQTKPHPQARKKQDTEKCRAYVLSLIIWLATWLWKTTQTLESTRIKENQTRQKVVLSQISQSDTSRMDCKKHQSRMNVYTGSNDVLYWLYNSHQISKGKTGNYPWIFGSTLVTAFWLLISMLSQPSRTAL